MCVVSTDKHEPAKEAVLVFDYLGISRCVTVVIAYLMHHMHWTLDVSIIIQNYFH